MRTLVLNRPERRNALSLTLLRDLISTLAETAADTSVHAVVVRGEGPAFCAGHDLSEMTGCSLSTARELFDTCSELMMAIHRLPQPVIAQVHGIATAAGCQLVAACDLAVASDDARFATPGVRIGLFCSTPMVEVSRAVGRKRALEMLLTGELIDAQTAADWGLVNRVVPRERLAQETLELAARITSASSHTLAIGKIAFYEQLDRALPEAYEHASAVMAANAVAPDSREGIEAFLSKREPHWQGRARGWPAPGPGRAVSLPAVVRYTLSAGNESHLSVARRGSVIWHQPGWSRGGRPRVRFRRKRPKVVGGLMIPEVQLPGASVRAASSMSRWGRRSAVRSCAELPRASSGSLTATVGAPVI